jgi:hypothetical protein
MARIKITKQWTLDLDEGFERRIEGGDLVLWSPGRTVYAAVYDTGNAEADEAIAAMLQDRPAKPVKTYDRVEAGLSGHAYLLPEGEGESQYWGLNTWTAAKGTVACVTFYFDSEHDLKWAVETWKSIRLQVESARSYVN